MKRLLLLALCAILSANAEARTIYVNASRPNNKGNGLSAKKAKKTLQAAINVARKGDTILVLPGTYAPIRTKNRKIAIKSVKGWRKTKILPSSESPYAVVADLSKSVAKHDAEYGCDYTEHIGNATSLSGFLLDGMDKEVCAIQCGNAKACVVRSFYIPQVGEFVVRGTRMSGCTIRNNYLFSGGSLFSGCTVGTTRILSNTIDNSDAVVRRTTCSNCLIAKNVCDKAPFFDETTLVNCTVADNEFRADDPSAYGSAFHNCILRNNFSQAKWEEWDDETGECIVRAGPKSIHNVDPGNVYKNTDKTNRNPKFVNAAKGNYKLKKGSYCINKGKLTKAQKKLVGTKDLAGRKRIKGRAIDRGCYEY